MLTILMYIYEMHKLAQFLLNPKVEKRASILFGVTSVVGLIAGANPIGVVGLAWVSGSLYAFSRSHDERPKRSAATSCDQVRDTSGSPQP